MLSSYQSSIPFSTKLRHFCNFQQVIFLNHICPTGAAIPHWRRMNKLVIFPAFFLALSCVKLHAKFTVHAKFTKISLLCINLTKPVFVDRCYVHISKNKLGILMKLYAVYGIVSFIYWIYLFLSIFQDPWLHHV